MVVYPTMISHLWNLTQRKSQGGTTMAKRLRALHKRAKRKALDKFEDEQYRLQVKRTQRRVFEILPEGGLSMGELPPGEHVVRKTANPIQPPTEDNEWFVATVKQNGSGTHKIGASIKSFKQLVEEGEVELEEIVPDKPAIDPI